VMGVSCQVIALRAEDEEFEKNYRVLVACRDADVDVPEQVAAYFGREAMLYEQPAAVAEHALEVEIPTVVLERGGGSEDRVVELAKLPKSVTRLVFRMSW